MGNTKTGTLGKLSRRVRRNTERAMKARGKREKAMQQASFVQGFSLGAEMRRIRLLNATAGYEYEEAQQHEEVEVTNGQGREDDPLVVSDGGSPAGDPMSESTLATDPYSTDDAYLG
jgi:hypothetical protein